MRSLVFLACFFFLNHFLASGQEVIQYNDTIYHTIQPKETLYGLGRMYQIDFRKLVELNNIQPPYSIKIGDKIMIPTVREVVKNTAVVKNEDKSQRVQQDSFNYIVTEFDASLRQLAVNYQVEVDSLSKWNHHNADDIIAKGQPIIISVGEEVPPLEIEDETNYKTVADYSMAEIKMGTVPIPQVERGKGQMVSVNNSNTKSIALYKTETMGDYIKVTNPENGKSVAVRVIGVIPNEEADNGVIIKLSQSACEQIGVVNKEFGVTVEYIH